MNEFFLSRQMPNQKKASGISYTVKVVKTAFFSWVTDNMEFRGKKYRKMYYEQLRMKMH